MNTSENNNPVIVDQLPTLPSGFAWLVTKVESKTNPGQINTQLWLEHTGKNVLVAWANVNDRNGWIQNPTVEQLTLHAESILAKTSTRWALDLPANLPKPEVM